MSNTNGFVVCSGRSYAHEHPTAIQGTAKATHQQLGFYGPFFQRDLMRVLWMRFGKTRLLLASQLECPACHNCIQHWRPSVMRHSTLFRGVMPVSPCLALSSPAPAPAATQNGAKLDTPEALEGLVGQGAATPLPALKPVVIEKDGVKLPAKP